jgi:hypothetical protein
MRAQLAAVDVGDRLPEAVDLGEAQQSLGVARPVVAFRDAVDGGRGDARPQGRIGLAALEEVGDPSGGLATLDGVDQETRDAVVDDLRRTTVAGSEGRPLAMASRMVKPKASNSAGWTKAPRRSATTR